jgi:hypothetical protein
MEGARGLLDENRDARTHGQHGEGRWVDGRGHDECRDARLFQERIRRRESRAAGEAGGDEIPPFGQRIGHCDQPSLRTAENAGR